MGQGEDLKYAMTQAQLHHAVVAARRRFGWARDFIPLACIGSPISQEMADLRLRVHIEGLHGQGTSGR